MMGFDPGIGLAAMVACGLVTVLLLGALIYLALRAFAPRHQGEQRDSARETLGRRLALGEIDPEEYAERESTLRSVAAGPGSRARGKPA